MNNDIKILRELAKKVTGITSSSKQDVRRKAWSNHNSLIHERPLIYMRAYAFHECIEKSDMKCIDPFYRDYEYKMHRLIFHDTLNDDLVLEPWLTVDAVNKALRWGVPVELGEKPTAHGAAAYKTVINTEQDIKKLVGAKHEIDEAATDELYNKLDDAVGDIIKINLNRVSQFGMWNMDISTDLAKLRGLEQIMWDAYDNPEFLHSILAYMRDTILKNHEDAENAGDFSLSCNQNQAVAYANNLERPKANIFGKKRSEIWGFMASQEFTTFSPDMFNEFMLRYQKPIIEQFGLSSYGCCEDLTNKISLLKNIKNLRRIAVSPFADVRSCAQQIGSDYIVSWRPNPSSMISTGLDEDFIRKHMRENFAIFKENKSFFDITLKDVETINHQKGNPAKWVQIVREEIDRAGL